MKYIFTVLLMGVFFVGSAQSPFLVNYQGIARDGSGNTLANQAITLKFEILQGSATGSVIYTDNQTGITTSSLGLFSTQIGKNGTLGQVSWTGGSYFLQVSMDPAGGSNLVVLGTQQIVSVPFSMHAQTVPSTYTNNILTIGSKTHAISSGTPITVMGTGTNVLVGGGPSYTVSYMPPTLALTSNNASISIVGGNAVAFPASITPTIAPSGIATVINGASVYTVGVPAPGYNPVTGVLSFGSNNTVVTPTLQLSGGVLYSGPFSNSVAIPGAVTVAGSGLASVSGAPNYVVNVPAPVLALSPNNLSLSIVGSNSITLPAAVTVMAPASNIITVSGGPQSYTVSAPTPVYNGTVLTLGATNTTIAPTLFFNSVTGALTSGATSNSVSLSSFGPFGQAGSTVTLTTLINNVAIGQSVAGAKLDVFSGSVGTVLKVTDGSTGNTSAAAAISSGGAKSLDVTNNGTNGVGGAFNSATGPAITAQNNSAAFAAITAQNTNLSTGAYAGSFVGGIAIQGNGATSSDFAMKVNNNASANLLMVRNDGNIGIGTNTPAQKLDVAGSVKITDGTEGLGKVFTSDAAGKGSWQALTITTTGTFTYQTLGSVNSTPSTFSNSLGSFTKVNGDTKIQVIVQTHLYVEDLVGNFGAIFEVSLNNGANVQAVSNSGKVAYFIDNAGATLNPPEYKSVTIIAEFTNIAAIPAGAYTVKMSASTFVGSATGLSMDTGNWGTSNIIVKEYR